MSRFGELYDKLVVMPGPSTFPAYYQLVKRVLKEAADEFPDILDPPLHMGGDYIWANPQKAANWFMKWFGVHPSSFGRKGE